MRSARRAQRSPFGSFDGSRPSQKGVAALSFNYRDNVVCKTEASACGLRLGLTDGVLRSNGKASQEVTDLIGYYFGDGTLTLVAARSVDTGEAQQNQGNPFIRQHFVLKWHVLRASLYRKQLAARFDASRPFTGLAQNPSTAA